MKSALAIAFDYRPSRQIAAAAALVSIAAVLAPWFSSLSLPLCAALSLAALALGGAAIRRFLHPPFLRIALRSSGWLLIDASGREHPARLASHARLGAFLSLDFRPASGRRRFRALLAPDNTDADTRRRLVPMLARGEVLRAG